MCDDKTLWASSNKIKVENHSFVTQVKAYANQVVDIGLLPLPAQQ